MCGAFSCCWAMDVQLLSCVCGTGEEGAAGWDREGGCGLEGGGLRFPGSPKARDRGHPLWVEEMARPGPPAV